MANNGSSSSQISEAILDAFEIIAQAEVDSAQYDKTITGIIISCEDESTGRYRVQYQDAIFYAFSSALDVTYSKGTSVQVKIPNNDFSGRKMIIGTAEEGGIDYGTIVEDPLLRYEYIGMNCLNSSFGVDISSYWTNQKIVEKQITTIYDKVNNINKVGLDEEVVYTNIKQGNSVLLGASIKTAIPEEQRFHGDYGIIYTFTFNDISNVEDTIDRYYVVDIDKMSGDPYMYTNLTNQIIPFDIDNENFLYVKKIEIFIKDFIHKNDDYPADIHFENIQLQAANRIPDEEFAGTALILSMPEGNAFLRGGIDDTKPVIAQLRIKGRSADSLKKQTQYYWFREDLRVGAVSSDGYQKYGGRGWYCLNDFNIIDEATNKKQYVSTQDTLQIKREDLKSQQAKYKCVVLYNGQTLSREFMFGNNNINTTVNIICDRDSKFVDGIGATTMTCIAAGAVSYQWAKIDNEGGFTTLRETTAENNEFHNAVEEYNDLIRDIETNSKPDNKANQELLALYQKIIQSYNNKERREGNQIINLQASSIYKDATYKCQAFDSNGNSLGIASQLISNYLTSGEDVQTGSLVIDNGSQVFKYDANGIAPTSTQFEDPQTILPLSFTLRNAQGVEVQHSALRDSDITWIVPIKDTMINNYTGSVVSYDEESGVEIYNGKSLGYNINENYYANKDNNEIELQVRYQGLVYAAKTNFSFLKDGDNGTNGTGYVLKILPGPNTIGRLKAVYPGETGRDWLRIQLWYNGIRLFEGDHSETSEVTGKFVKLEWEMVGEKKDTPHNITVENVENAQPRWTAATSYNSEATDIVKAIVNYDGMRIVATMPIIYCKQWITSSYNVSLKHKTGFTHVVYSEDGLTPIYDNKMPFEIAVYKSYLGDWGDITGHDNMTYKWGTIGNLKIKRGYSDTDQAVMFEPAGKYNSEETNNAITCKVMEGATSIAEMHIPVHFLLNTYGHAALNEWDGNSIRLDADGNQMLLAPQGGFGYKEGDNSYTGVLLGTVKDYNNNGEQSTGLFGYKAGTRTMFLNSENGSAIFGSSGKAQVIIDPNQDKAKLYSGDFYKTYDSKTGLPSYSSSNESGTGAMIDLTTPEIRWGNGNFIVNTNGHITAKGGGKIAGWNIDDTALFTGNKDNSSNVQIASSDFSRTINGTQRTNWRMAFSNNFGVSSEGIVHAASGIIGSGTNKITLGKSQGDNAYSALYAGKNKFDANTNGFYLGTDGIALGSHNGTNSAFQVTSSGQLTARSGYIGNGSNGWTIGNSSLYNTKDSLDADKTGVFLSTSGISLGKLADYSDVTGNASPDNHSKFKVKSDGTLYANGGYFRGKINANGGKIAGWTINTNSISSGNIKLNSGGSMSGGEGDYTWSINTNGKATFNNATISGNLTATTGKIGNWSISEGKISNGNTTLTADGKISATEANISGTITANYGKIAGYTISGQQLIGSDVGMCGSSGPAYAFWAGNNDSAAAPFRVGHDGSLRATKATIEGNITATSGSFDNCTISNCTVTNTCKIPASTINGQLAEGNIPQINASKISGGTISAKTRIEGPDIVGGTISLTGEAGQTNFKISNGNRFGYMDAYGVYFCIGSAASPVAWMTSWPNTTGNLTLYNYENGMCTEIYGDSIGTTSVHTDELYVGNGKTATIECMAANSTHKWKMWFEYGVLTKASYGALSDNL